MNIVLLSGGSGTRLWPLSNDVRLDDLTEGMVAMMEQRSVHLEDIPCIYLVHNSIKA